jgi:hypothetical protein
MVKHGVKSRQGTGMSRSCKKRGDRDENALLN